MHTTHSLSFIGAFKLYAGVDVYPCRWCGYVVNLRSSRQAWFPSTYVEPVPVDENIGLLHLLQFPTGVALFEEHLISEHSSENLKYVHLPLDGDQLPLHQFDNRIAVS